MRGNSDSKKIKISKLKFKKILIKKRNLSRVRGNSDVKKNSKKKKKSN